jgi:hypothetical protein
MNRDTSSKLFSRDKPHQRLEGVTGPVYGKKNATSTKASHVMSTAQDSTSPTSDQPWDYHLIAEYDKFVKDICNSRDGSVDSILRVSDMLGYSKLAKVLYTRRLDLDRGFINGIFVQMALYMLFTRFLGDFGHKAWLAQIILGTILTYPLSKQQYLAGKSDHS